MNKSDRDFVKAMSDDELRNHLNWMISNLTADTPAWFQADFEWVGTEWNKRGAK